MLIVQNGFDLFEEIDFTNDNMDSSNKVTYTFKTSTMTDKGRITTTIITHFEPTQTKKKPCCYRCGRNTHLKPDCYATFHLKGYELYD